MPQDVIEYRKIVITDSELRDCDTDEAAHDRLEMLLNLTPRSSLFWINGAMQHKQIIFTSEDLEVEDQFTTHTYTLRDDKVIYSTGNDHIVNAIRCAMLVREEGNLDPIGEETVSLKPVLTDPVFV